MWRVYGLFKGERLIRLIVPQVKGKLPQDVRVGEVLFKEGQLLFPGQAPQPLTMPLTLVGGIVMQANRPSIDWL